MLITNYSKNINRAKPLPATKKGISIAYDESHPIRFLIERNHDKKWLSIQLNPGECFMLGTSLLDAHRQHAEGTAKVKPMASKLWALSADFGVSEKRIIDALVSMAYDGLVKPSELRFELNKPRPSGDVLIISVDYTEGKQSTYKAVEVTDGNGGVKRFDGGLPEADFLNASAWAHKQKPYSVMLSSSCDHFVSDGYRFGWKVSEHGFGEVIYRMTDDEIARLNRPV